MNLDIETWDQLGKELEELKKIPEYKALESHYLVRFNKLDTPCDYYEYNQRVGTQEQRDNEKIELLREYEANRK